MAIVFEQFIITTTGDDPESWPTERVGNNEKAPWFQVIAQAMVNEAHLEALTPISEGRLLAVFRYDAPGQRSGVVW